MEGGVQMTQKASTEPEPQPYPRLAPQLEEPKPSLPQPAKGEKQNLASSPPEDPPPPQAFN